MSVVVFIIAVLYWVVGQKLTLDACKYLRTPTRTYLYTPLLSPEEFTPEGEPLRLRAVRYWYGGAVVVGVLFTIVWVSQRI